MEGFGSSRRRISMASSSGSRPQPQCGGRRRVVATKKRDLVSINNSVNKIQRREISSKRHPSFSISNSVHRFRNIRLTVNYLLLLIPVAVLILKFEDMELWINGTKIHCGQLCSSPIWDLGKVFVQVKQTRGAF